MRLVEWSEPGTAEVRRRAAGAVYASCAEGELPRTTCCCSGCGTASCGTALLEGAEGLVDVADWVEVEVWELAN